MVVYLKNPRESTKKLVEIINNFSKVAGCKINAHKSSAFLYISNASQQPEFEREILFRITLDNVKYLGIGEDKHRNYINTTTKHFPHN